MSPCAGTPPHLTFRAFVALGGNLGDAHATLERALLALHTLPFTAIEAVSPAYVTAPVDSTGPDYVNAVAAIQTRLAPLELLHALQAIEQQHGRERPYMNAPRTLDLDLIWMAGATRQSTELLLPHPRWAQRAFVVEPLADVMGLLGEMHGPVLPSPAERQHLIAAQGIQRSTQHWTHHWPMLA
jgi:2-amino-4-hydroxy-6-hydroxymethyldihydropteridine diphosphokinase